MAESVRTDTSDRARHRKIAGCAIVIIILGAGSALLPVIDPGAGAMIVGSMLFVAGLVEVYAGTLHRQAKGLSVLAGAVTTCAGLLLTLNPLGHFFPTALLVTGWLIVRSVVLLLAGRYSAGSVRMWTLSSAAMDFFLAIVLFMGLSLSTLVISLFGPTSLVVGGFAWILALSFFVTGAMLLEIASSERSSTY